MVQQVVRMQAEIDHFKGEAMSLSKDLERFKRLRSEALAMMVEDRAKPLIDV